MASGTFIAQQPSISTAGMVRTGRFNYVYENYSYPDLSWVFQDDSIVELEDVDFPEEDRRFMYVNLDGNMEEFKYNGTSNPYRRAGAVGSLNCNTVSGYYVCTYSRKDGTKSTYLSEYQTYKGGNPHDRSYLVTSINRPNGEIITYTYWKFHQPTPTNSNAINSYVKTVHSNFGWTILYDYKSVYDPTNPNDHNGGFALPNTGTVRIINNSVDYCAGPDIRNEPSAWDRPMELTNVCNIADATKVPTLKWVRSMSNLPDQNYFFTFKDHLDQPLGTVGPYQLVSPLGVVTNISTTHTDYIDSYENWSEPTEAFVTKVQRGNIYRKYSYVSDPDHGKIFTACAHDASLPYVTCENSVHDSSYKLIIDTHFRSPLSVMDNMGRIWQYEYNDPDGMLIKVTSPEGGYTTYTYDSYDGRRNITTIKVYPKPGSGLATLTTTYTYEATCDASNFRYCDKPKSVTDPLGYTTDYAYYPENGQVRTVTLPADSGGVRPQTRYTYTAKYAKEKNTSGVLVTNTQPIYLLTSVSTCRVATVADPASCVHTSDETVTTYAYDNNNLLKTAETVAQGAPDNAPASSQPYSTTNVWATTTYTYDSYVGNLISVDGPRVDVDDKTYTTYDSRRRPVYEVGVDPDGTCLGNGNGCLKRLIVHHTYDADGNETLTETGTGNATDGSDFVATSFKRMTYDPTTGLLTKTEVGQP